MNKPKRSTPFHRDGSSGVRSTIKSADHDDAAMRDKCREGTRLYERALKASGYKLPKQGPDEK